MLKEIIKKYEKFADALIYQVSYYVNFNQKKAEIVIRCMNSFNNYNFEYIKIIFIDVIFIRFIEKEITSSTLINSALLKEENNIITFDFFPLFYDEDDLRENQESDFIIKCKKIEYRTISDFEIFN